MRFLIVFILFATTVFGQKKLEFRKANNLYNKMEYATAIPVYEAYLEKDTSNVEALTKLADSYKKINDSRHAERVYQKLIATNPADPQIYLSYAEALTENGKYAEAKAAYTVYGQKVNNDARAQNYISALNNMSDLYRDSSKYKVHYLSINSPQADFSPAFYKNGLVFSSGRKQGIGSKRVFKYNHSAFLNLYYLDDTSKLKREAFQTNKEADAYPTVAYNNDKNDHKGIYSPNHPDETHPTSNDTRTVGYYNTTFSKKNINGKGGSETKVVPFSSILNSKYHEGPMTFSPTGDTVYFTRNNYNQGVYKKSDDGVNKLKIYSAIMRDSAWFDVQEFDQNDNQYSTGHPTLSANGQTMYFASDRPGGFGGTDIWYSKLQNGTWQKPENAGETINTAGQEMFPYLDNSGNLFYSSDGLGGLGGLDIFQATKSATGFSKPQNMGFPINSKKDDFGIATSKDGTYGFLSSNRKDGGYDDDIYSFAYAGPQTIFIQVLVVDKLSGKFLSKSTVSEMELGQYSADEKGKVLYSNANIGSMYMVKGVKEDYLPNSVAANTTGLKRGDTLQVIVPLERKEIVLIVKGTAKNDDGNPIPDVKIKLVDKCTGAEKTIITQADGNYLFPLQKDNCYLVIAEKPNCGVIVSSVSTNGVTTSQEYVRDFELLCKGDVVKMDNIYFDRGKHDIRPDAANELVKVLPLLNKYPGMRIELRSHTDCRASDAYNLALSDRRAKASASFLVSKGIAANRIVGKGYGETLLLNKCDDGIECTEEEHQINRRTEFKILTMGTALKIKKTTDPSDTCQCKSGNAVSVAKLTGDTQGIKLQGETYKEQDKSKLEGVNVLLTDNATGKFQEVASDASGNFNFDLQPNTNYTLTASKTGCASFTKVISTVNVSNGIITQNIPFLCEGDVIKVENIYYDLNKYFIRPDAAKELDKLVEIFKTHPSMKVELSSHTDCRSSAQYNQTLSDNRAKASVAYIVKKGVNSSQIVAKGYGETQLLNDCACENGKVSRVCSEAEHQTNRRTEVKVLSVE